MPTVVLTYMFQFNVNGADVDVVAAYSCGYSNCCLRSEQEARKNITGIRWLLFPQTNSDVVIKGLYVQGCTDEATTTGSQIYRFIKTKLY